MHMGMFDLIRLLAEKGVDFVLVGGLAVALHGYQRVTMDVDVVLAMDDANLERFMDGTKSAGLCPTIPVPIESLARAELIDQWHREKGMLAFSLRGREAQATVLDVLVHPAVPYAELRAAAIMMDMGPYRIAVASIDHLIAMKTGTGRGKDAIDIEELRKLQAADES
jgi:predicted nucleotidyltransferase